MCLRGGVELVFVPFGAVRLRVCLRGGVGLVCVPSYRSKTRVCAIGEVTLCLRCVPLSSTSSTLFVPCATVDQTAYESQ